MINVRIVRTKIGVLDNAVQDLDDLECELTLVAKKPLQPDELSEGKRQIEKIAQLEELLQQEKSRNNNEIRLI